MRNLAIALCILLGLAVRAGAQDETVEVYKLKPGDVVEISVLEDASLNRQVLVRPDGRISLPLAGTIVAADRTPDELQAAIGKALAKDFVEPPTVSVALTSTPGGAAEQEEPALVYVLGQVPNPGRFEIMGPIDVLKALAIAGGPGVFAAKSRIQIRKRDENGGETVRLFDYTAIEDGSGVELIVIDDGDVIVVPERGLFE